MSEQELEVLIMKTVIATRRACQRETNDTTKATERRLLAYPILQKKIADDGSRSKNKECTFDQYMENVENKQEIELLETALSIVSKDSHYGVVAKRFLEGKTLEEIAEEEHCDIRTVRRNKNRLIGLMAVYLYGACATL